MFSQASKPTSTPPAPPAHTTYAVALEDTGALSPAARQALESRLTIALEKGACMAPGTYELVLSLDGNGLVVDVKGTEALVSCVKQALNGVSVNEAKGRKTLKVRIKVS